MNLLRCLFLTGIVALPSLLIAQTNPVPNGGFENWNSGDPESWLTTNIPGVVVPITQSSNAHSGSSSIQGTVLTFSNEPYVPLAQAFFPVNASYGICSGWYTFSPVGGDSLLVSVIAWRAETPIGGGSYESGVAVSSFTQFSFPVEYSMPGPADSVWIFITVTSSDSLHAGTTFLIDDLTLTSPTGVSTSAPVPSVYSLAQNYPNPFNPSTTIGFDVPTRSSVRLTLLNILGQTVGELLSGVVEPGHTTVTWTATVPSGVYLYRLEAQAVGGAQSSFTQTRRMVVLK